MSQNDVSTLTEIMTRFTGYVGKRLPTDVIKKLEELRSKEKDELSLAKVVMTRCLKTKNKRIY